MVTGYCVLGTVTKIGIHNLVTDDIWYMVFIMTDQWKLWIVYVQATKNENNQQSTCYLFATKSMQVTTAFLRYRQDVELHKNIKYRKDKEKIRTDWGWVMHGNDGGELKMMVKASDAVQRDGDDWRMAQCQGGQWVVKYNFWWAVSGEMEPFGRWHGGDGTENWR